MDKNNYLWYTDLHINRLLPWHFYIFIKNIQKENPKGIFLTGDISNGIFTCMHLKILATFIKCPIYFVLGNHDYYLNNFNKQHKKIHKMCLDYPNLIWVTEHDVIHLNDDIALIGAEGWYDANIGNPKYLELALDRFMISDFRQLKTSKERLNSFREISYKSTISLENKLKNALDKKYKSVYLLTHFPPWKEATRSKNSILEKYYIPYNTNLQLGQMLEALMADYPDKDLHVFCGHTHEAEYIRVSKNINCQVGASNQLRAPHSQRIFI